MSVKTEFSKFNFISKEFTGYDSFYHYFAKYLQRCCRYYTDKIDPSTSMEEFMKKLDPDTRGMFEGNFSTANLVNCASRVCRGTDLKNYATNSYELDFDKLSNLLILVSNPDIKINTKTDGVKRKLTEEESADLLERLKSASRIPSKINGRMEFVNNPEVDSFRTVDEFVKYARTNVNSENTEKLRKTIVEESLEVADKRFASEIRHRWLAFVYSKVMTGYFRLPYIETKDEEFAQSIATYDRERKIVDFITQTVLRADELETYDDMYFGYLEETRASNRKRALSRALTGKRTEVVTKAITKNLTPEEKNLVSESGIKSLWIDKTEKKNVPNIGDVDWYVETYDKPDLLCDTLVRYSESGEEDQRVVAISYGKFHYKDRIFDNSLVQPELVSISRVGKDGVNTYSVIMPIDSINFRSTRDLADGERRYNLSVNGKRTSIKDLSTSQTLYGVETKKIPPEFAEFWAKYFTSDLRLKTVEEEIYRYAGFISRTTNGPKITGYDIGKSEFNAARYACLYPGRIGRANVSSLDAFCTSPSFMIKHTSLVSDVINDRLDPSKLSTSYNAVPAIEQKEDGGAR